MGNSPKKVENDWCVPYRKSGNLIQEFPLTSQLPQLVLFSCVFLALSRR